MRHQKGHVFKKGSSWYVRWYENVYRDGALVKAQPCKKIADVCDRYRNKADVRALADEVLRPINTGKVRPESTLTLAEYGDFHFMPHVEADLKPSTHNGYKWIWNTYIKPRAEKIPMRDFRCVDATTMLADIHAEHGLGRQSLRHCKSVLSAVFTYAKQQGVIDGINPVMDAAIPRKAAKSKPTHAATPTEVSEMLNVLSGNAKVAVALMFFAGLRPGECRGLKWSDYDGKLLHVRRAVWNTHVSDPKTEDSIAPVPVADTLREILDEHRSTCSGSEWILCGQTNQPLDLHNLAARTIKPTLKEAKAQGKFSG